MKDRIKIIEEENLKLDQFDGVLPEGGLLVKIYAHNMEKGKELKRQILNDYEIGNKYDKLINLGVKGILDANCELQEEINQLKKDVITQSQSAAIYHTERNHYMIKSEELEKQLAQKD